MPEMNSAAENEDYKAMFGTAYIFVIQNVGMLFGFGVIFLMALYGTEIDLEGWCVEYSSWIDIPD